MNDALLSGSAHFISAGPPAFLVLWDRTRTNVGVKAVAAISSMPKLLNARNAQSKSLDAVTPAQKIAVTSVKGLSPRSSCRCMRRRSTARTRLSAFDPSTVPHGPSGRADRAALRQRRDRRPLGVAAVRPARAQGSGDSHLMNSDDVMGGSTTFTMMSTTTKFHNENPKVYGAVVKALRRAQEMIAQDRKGAAAVLLESMGGKGWSLDELVAILSDPATKYTPKSEHVMAYAGFMHDSGSLKNAPASLGDVFFDAPEIAGSN